MDPSKDAALEEARRFLEAAIVRMGDRPVGTVAASDAGREALNYDQVFVRDFVPAGLAFLAQGETEIVRNFLEVALELQIEDVHLDCHVPGRGAMPASFKVRVDDQGMSTWRRTMGTKRSGASHRPTPSSGGCFCCPAETRKTRPGRTTTGAIGPFCSGSGRRLV